MEIPTELKDKMKEQRLNQYRQQIFTLQMDKVALESVGNTAEAEKAQKAIDDLEKAFAAIEVM